MKLPYDLIIFDLEANQPSNNIFEIGAVYLNRNFETCDTFSRYVNPGEKLSPFIIELCKVNEEQEKLIAEAPPLEFISNMFYLWAKDVNKTSNFILASWGNYDSASLHSQDITCRFRKKALDIKSIATWELARLGLKSSDGMSSVRKVLGLDPVAFPHHALNDALSACEILQKLYLKSWDFKEMLSSLTASLA